MFYILCKYELDPFDFAINGYILCEDGQFRFSEQVMGTDQYTPILFTSKADAQQAKKMLGGHWPWYKIIEISDPSWLN